MERNNTSFPIQITSRIKELYSIYEKDNKWLSLLAYYQYIVKYIITDSHYKIKDGRGLLLYFTMGMGKTRTAVSVALSVTNMPVIVILPKSLQSNFTDTLKYIEKETGQPIKNNIKYISMDAYNAANQLDKIESGIDNSLVIIDEAHNFFRAIINGSQESNAYKIYEQLMNARNIKLLFLTGTPISKNPFELVPCINLLAGSDILPIQYDQFNDLYVDLINRDIKNRSYLANRILGLVSYMTMSDTSKHMFPTELPTIISKVEMSTIQYRKYLQAREKEEVDKKGREYVRSEKRVPMSLPKQVSMSSYYIKSRSMSNYVDPLTKDDPITEDNGPKLSLIAKRVFALHGLSMVYSQFVNNHGLKQLTIFLERLGFKEFTDNSHGPHLRYALYTGDVPTKLREKILKIFNSNENKYGSVIKVILISKTGAEGLDLKNVRETHQIEPYWDLARDKQVKARAVRYGSHLALPEDERTVQPYLYISVANEKMWSSMREREPKTIDEIFHDRAVEQDIINTKFNDLLKDVSIECSYFHTTNNCYVCNPSNEKLFTRDPLIDTKMSNPCIFYEETEKSANRININGNEYYYTENPFHVYKFDIILDGYIEIIDDPVIEQIQIEIKK